MNKGGQRGDQGGGGWVAFDTKISKSTNSKISSKSGGVCSIEESKSGIIQKANSLVGMKQHSNKRGKNTPRGGGRMRTLSNSELSSSAKGSNDEVNRVAEMSDADSWTVSHDMLMIDEVHTSEESENLSAAGKCHTKNRKPVFFDLGIVGSHHQDQMRGEPFGHQSLLSSDDDDWTKVRPPRSQRQHIELKDITENDFLSMIEAKN